ncbi:MAG: hypothetical protein QMC67_10115 [Candidatus Wallbacteria bacterium]
MTENKLLLTFDEIVDLSTVSAAGIKIAGTSLVSPSDTIAARNLSTQDTYAVLTVNSKSFNEADQANGIAGGTLNTGIEIAAESNIKNITGRKIMTFTAGMTISGDKTPPKDLTPAQTAALLFNNSTHQSFTTQPMAYSELAKLEVCFSPDPVPSLNLTAYSESAFAFSHNANDVIISSITAQNSGLMIFYRLKDRAGNVSGWVGNGNVPSTSNFSSIIITANQNGCGNSQNYINDKLASSVKNSAAPLNTENLTVVFGTAPGAGNVKLSMKNGSNIANFESLANGSSAELMFSLKSGNAGQSLKDILGTSDGSLEVSFTVTDNAGNVSALTTDNLTVKYDVSVPVLSAAQLGKLAYGASKKVVIARGDLTGPDAYSEPAVLELCISTTLPVSNVSLNGYEQTFTQTHNQGDIIISSVINGAANDGVYYRLRDQAGNFGAWQQNGVTPFGPVVSNLAAHKGFGHIAASGGVSNIADTATMLKIFEDDDNNETNGGVNLVAAVTGIDLSMANGVIKNGLTLTSGKFIGYSIATKEGNESPIVYDGKIPQMPAPADLNCLSFSNLFKEVRAVGGPVAPGPGADPDLKLILYKNNAGVRIQAAIAPSENGSTGYQPGAQIISLASPLDDDTGISYAFVNSTGNCSAFADDGTVPAPPSAADVSGIYYTKAYSAVWSKNGSIIGDTTSTDLKLQIFENIGTVFALKGTAANVNGASGYAAGILIIDGVLPLADNSYAAYAFVNSNGNQSRAAGREIVPAPPLVSNIRWINGKKAFEIIDGNVEITAAGNFLEVYEKDGASHLYKGRSVLAMTGTPYSTLLQDAALSIITGGREITYTSRTPAGNESAFADDGIVPQAPENAIVNNLCLRYNGPDYSLYNYEVSSVPLNYDLKVMIHDIYGSADLILAGKVLNSACANIAPSSFAPGNCFDPSVSSSANGLKTLPAGGALRYVYVKPGTGPGDGNESDIAFAGLIPAKPDSPLDNLKVKNDFSSLPFKYRLYNSSVSQSINIVKNLKVYVGDVYIGQALPTSNLYYGTFAQNYYAVESSDETALKNTAINGGALALTYYDGTTKNESAKYVAANSAVPQKPLAAVDFKIKHSRYTVANFCVYNSSASNFTKEANTELAGYLGTSLLTDRDNPSSNDVIGASTLTADTYGVALSGLSAAGGPLTFVSKNTTTVNESPAVFAGVVPEAPSNFTNLRVKYDNSEQPQYRLYAFSGATAISSEVAVFIGLNSMGDATHSVTLIKQNGTIASGDFGTDNILPNPNGGILKAMTLRNGHESLWVMNQPVPTLDFEGCKQLRIKNGQNRSQYSVKNIGSASFLVPADSTVYIGNIRTNLSIGGSHVISGDFFAQTVNANPNGGKFGISRTAYDNESMIYGDTFVPAEIAGGNLTWSNAFSSVKVKNIAVGTGTEEIRIYSKNIDNIYEYSGRTASDTNDSLSVTFAANNSYKALKENNEPVVVSNTVAYSLYNIDGNESPYVDGGAVPASLISGDLKWSNATHCIKVNNQDGVANTNEELRVYSKPGAAYEYVGRTADSSNITVKGPFSYDYDYLVKTNAGMPAVIGDDQKIYYTLFNTDGNESELLDGGFVPKAPPANNIAWLDKNSSFKITGATFGSETSELAVYQKTWDGQAIYSYQGSPVILGDMTTTDYGPYSSNSEHDVRCLIDSSYVPVTISSATDAFEVAYTMKNTDGNESSYTDGGIVPVAPPAESLRWSNAASKFTTSNTFGSETEELLVYQMGDGQYTLRGTSADKGPYIASNSYATSQPALIELGNPVAYTLRNTIGNESASVNGGSVPQVPSNFASLKVVNDKTAMPFKYRLYNSDGNINITMNKSVRVYVGGTLIGRTATADNFILYPYYYVSNYIEAESSSAVELKDPINGGQLAFTYYDAANGNESGKYEPANGIVPKTPSGAKDLKIRHSQTTVSQYILYNSSSTLAFNNETDTTLKGYVGTQSISSSTESYSTQSYGFTLLQNLTSAGGPLNFVSVSAYTNEAPAVFAGVMPAAPTNIANFRVKYDGSMNPNDGSVNPVQYKLYAVSAGSLSSDMIVYIGNSSLGESQHSKTQITQNGPITANTFGTDIINPNPQPTNDGRLKAISLKDGNESLWAESTTVPGTPVTQTQYEGFRMKFDGGMYKIRSGSAGLNLDGNMRIWIGNIYMPTGSEAIAANSFAVSQSVGFNPAGGRLGISYLDPTSGNESMIYGNTAVPAQVNVSNIGWSNAASSITVRTAKAGTATEEIRIYDPDYIYKGHTAALDNSSLAVELLPGSYKAMEEITGNPVYIAGSSLYYTLYNSDGNESIVSSISQMPMVVDAAYASWNAGTQKIDVSSSFGDTNDFIKVYNKTTGGVYTYLGISASSGMFGSGSYDVTSTINVTDTAVFTLYNSSTGNESGYSQ